MELFYPDIMLFVEWVCHSTPLAHRFSEQEEPGLSCCFQRNAPVYLGLLRILSRNVHRTFSRIDHMSVYLSA